MYKFIRLKSFYMLPHQNNIIDLFFASIHHGDYRMFKLTLVLFKGYTCQSLKYGFVNG